MAHIPDEIISEILSPALRVSDVAFSSMADRSPFLSFSESPSAYLVVCKAWLRCATPLLYHVVVLRSRAQAQALAETLNSSPDLGRFVKKLRVEGGFASTMYKVLKMTPNITDLYLTLTIAASDNASGLIKGLPLISPSRVIVNCPAYSWLPKSAQKFADEVKDFIPAWSNLTVFQMTHPQPHSSLDVNPLAKALAHAPKLEKLVLIDHFGPQDFPNYLRVIAGNPNLRCIQFQPPLCSGSRSPYQMQRVQAFISRLLQDDRLKAVVELPDETTTNKNLPADENPSIDIFFVYPPKLAADPLQEDVIWSRVFSFVFSHPRGYREKNYMAPVLVSKKFARLGIPHLYSRPSVKSSSTLVSFSNRLAEDPSLGSHVRSLSLGNIKNVPLFKSIIKHTPALIALNLDESCLAITWTAFNELGRSTGDSLLSLHGVRVSKSSGPVDPSGFALFAGVQDFSWSSRCGFKTSQNLTPSNTFHNLANLAVNLCDKSFLTVLSQLELPSLRSAQFSTSVEGGASFFRKHGQKLETLTVSHGQLMNTRLAVLKNCPSITVLTVFCDEKDHVTSSVFEPAAAHACLERIVIKTPSYRMRQPDVSLVDDFMRSMGLPHMNFPALHEIEHPWCRWPTNEADINKSKWVQWAEMLLDRNIHLVDSKHAHWRPRLKFVAKGLRSKR